MHPKPSRSNRRWQLTVVLAMLGATLAQAQTAPAAPAAETARNLARYDKNNNGVLDPDEQAAMRADDEAAGRPATDGSGREVVVMSPFEVRADNNGYQASNTLSGTRLNSKIEDLAASITVVTKQQLMDTAAVDINDIFSNEANTEGIYQYTEWQQDRGFTIDVVQQSPEVANRMRGLGNANLARGNFATSSAIPVDTYNIDAVEISRGPNSNIFGLGEASGTVNLIQSRANPSRESTQVILRADSSGGYRASLDVNRPIIQDKLGIRLTGLYEDREFERKPSRDKTNRLFAAVTWRPFENTTIRGSYESYHNFNTRANSTTPRDTITEWRANGSPVWDPTFSNNTGGWRLLGGSTYTAVTPANEGTQLPRGINPQFTSFWNRPSWFVDGGQVALYMVNRANNTGTATNLSNPGTANANLRYLQNGTILQRGGGAFGFPPTPLFQQPGITDQSLYDWEEINYAAPNFGTKKADIYQVDIEQWIVNTQMNKLAFQAGFLREDVDVLSRNFIGASDGAPPTIAIDINEKLLDGTPNPFFLRPYIGGSEMQTFRRPELNDNARVTAAYQLDLTQEEGWRKWIGRHNFAAYGEFRQNVSNSNPNGLRYRDQIISNEPWMSAANLTNIPGRGAGERIFTRYYLGGPVTDAGPLVDVAPMRPFTPHGSHTLRYFNGNTGQWLNETVETGDVYFALGMQKRQIRTMGLVWQGFLWNDRIIPTAGIRKDRTRQVFNGTVPLKPDGYLDETKLYDFPENWITNSGPTRTKGVVIVPFKDWRAIDAAADGGGMHGAAADFVRSLRFHYNESDSFTPASLSYSLYGDLLTNPTGTGKDYGFSFSALDGKLHVKVNKYETLQVAARNGSTGVLATRPLRLDFDTSGDNAVFGAIGGDSFDLEDVVTQWVVALNPTITEAAAKTQVYQTMGLTEEFINRIKNLPSISDINNVESKGMEIEINYNPNRYWTLKSTITKQQAIDKELSPLIAQYVEERMPFWTSIRVPTGIVPATGQPLPGAGQLWWDVGIGTATGNNIPRNFFSGNVDAPYALAVTNSGKPRPQTREWRFTATTNYKLAGLTDHKWFKNMSVGGTLRWEDEAVVGFFGQAPDADGAIRRLDGNRPIYDKARTYVDLLWTYDFRLWNSKVKTRLQLNVRNAFESGRLQAISYNPDGTPWNFRIIDPRQFILTATFDL
ncbi:MAG TPA: TonB-dependent receptor plug domain-containing protein [Opitutaceae bacterium]|nr:TonB-dependent receptor plug domain-containing protein [Opitutaceae bacterium]